MKKALKIEDLQDVFKTQKRTIARDKNMIDSTIFYKTLTVLYIDSNKITSTYFFGVLEKTFLKM